MKLPASFEVAGSARTQASKAAGVPLGALAFSFGAVGGARERIAWEFLPPTLAKLATLALANHQSAKSKRHLSGGVFGGRFEIPFSEILCHQALQTTVR